MDNVTHGLFGYALARAMKGRAGDRERSAFVWTSVLASNAPDLDLVVNFFAHDPKLAYLVHHRGHTHTLLWALPLGALVGSLVAAGHRLSDRSAWLRVVGLGALAGALHILFDAFNNYGVHPFHPLDSHWYYGDAVFIVEPLLLSALIPLLALRAKTRIARAFGWLLATVLGWLLLGAGVLPPGLGWVLVGVVIGALGLFLLFRLQARASLWALGVLVIGLFFASQVARARILRAFGGSHPDERVLEVSRSPYPGNPLCWSAVIVSLGDGGRYHGRRADLSLAPDLWPVDGCRWLRAGGRPTAPSAAPEQRVGRDLLLRTDFAAPVTELRELWQANCRAAAALRFVRAPFWIAGANPVLGDLRYDREPGLGFAEVPLQGSCEDPVPDWVPPRMDLLR